MAITKIDFAVSSSLLSALPPIIRAIRAALRDFENGSLTVSQFRVLGFVSLRPCTSKQLAEWQGVSLPAMSRMVSYLVQRRLLVRTLDTLDRRQVQLRLSTQGDNKFRRLRAAIELDLAARIATLGKPEKHALDAGLIALEKLFHEIE